jgi:hypothetical protein
LTLKYGKTPARPGAMKLALRSYVDISKLPPVPATFGHDVEMPTDWGMLANDQYGCCVWAGAAHETMMWNKEAGQAVSFTATDVLEDYAAVTGFKPSDPNTDGGTDMVLAAEYRRKVGVRDNKGARHKIAAYLQIQPGNTAELMAAAYLFGAVGIGFQMPETTQDQFAKGQPWSVVAGSKIEGGHYVPLVGRGPLYYHVVTWGRVQRVTPSFFRTYCDEAVAYVSLEALKNNKSPEGFDAAALEADLAQLHRA